MADEEIPMEQNVEHGAQSGDEPAPEDEQKHRSTLSRLVDMALVALKWFVAAPTFLIVGIGLGLGIGIPYYDKFGAGIYEKTVALAGWTGAALIVTIVLYLLLRYLVVRVAKSALGKSVADLSADFREPIASFIGKHLGKDWEKAFRKSGDNGLSFVKRAATLAFSILGAAGMLATIVGLFVALISLFALSVAQEELVASRWSNFLLCEQNSLIRTQGVSKFRSDKPILLRDTYADVQQLQAAHNELSKFAEACASRTCVLTKEQLAKLESIGQVLPSLNSNWIRSLPSQAGLVSKNEERGVVMRIEHMTYYIDYIKLAHLRNLSGDKRNGPLASKFRNVVPKNHLYLYMVDQGMKDSCATKATNQATLVRQNCRNKVIDRRGAEHIQGYLEQEFQKTTGAASKWIKLEETLPIGRPSSAKCEGWWLWCSYLEDRTHDHSNINWSRFTQRLNREVFKLDAVVTPHDPLCSKLLTEQQRKQVGGLKRESKGK